MKKKMLQTIFFGVLMLLVIAVSILTRNYNYKDRIEESKSYKHEIMDDSSGNPEIKGVQ